MFRVRNKVDTRTRFASSILAHGLELKACLKMGVFHLARINFGKQVNAYQLKHLRLMRVSCIMILEMKGRFAKFTLNLRQLAVQIHHFRFLRNSAVGL